MVNYQLTKKATKELEQIYEYSIVNFGLKQAKSYFTSLSETFNLIGENPMIGRNCDDILKGYRKHEHQEHVIYYRLEKENILIAHILGKKQDQARQLK